MTVLVQNTEVTNTFDFWRTRTNELAKAMSDSVVTVNSNTAVGDAAISGTFTAGILVSNTFAVNGSISVGNSTVNAVVNSTSIKISNSTINTSINSTSSSFTGSLTIGGSVSNTYVNTSTITIGNSISNTFISTSNIKISNSVSNLNIIIPTSTQFTNGNYFLNANGNWALITVPEVSSPVVYGNSTITSATVLDSFAKASYRTAEYTITTVNQSANGYTTSKLLVTHDGGNAYVTEYSYMYSNNHLCNFTASTNTTHVILTATPINGGGGGGMTYLNFNASQVNNGTEMIPYVNAQDYVPFNTAVYYYTGQDGSGGGTAIGGLTSGGQYYICTSNSIGFTLSLTLNNSTNPVNIGSGPNQTQSFGYTASPSVSLYIKYFKVLL